jgi:PKD repeat protein
MHLIIFALYNQKQGQYNMKFAKHLLLSFAAFLFSTTMVQGQCAASYTAYDSSGTVYFFNTSSVGNPATTTSTWSFGDGTSGTSSGLNMMTHTYTSNGVYLVCLMISDSFFGCTDTICDSVVVGNSVGGCSAYYTYTNAGCTFNFTDNSTCTGSPVTYLWDFGDGSPTSTLMNPSHTYAANGNYTVCLSVADGNGNTDTWCSTVTCGNPPPCQASYSWVHDSTGAFTILLFNTSNFGAPATSSYLWTFGDGTSSTLAYPSHVYAGVGTYVVCLTITDTNCTSTYCDSIPVTYKTNQAFSINVVGGLTNNNPAKESFTWTAFPNPFSNVITVKMNLTEAVVVKLELVDLAGRVIHSQSEGLVAAGDHQVEVTPRDLAAGIYMLHIQAGEKSYFQKLIAE